jgi:hypothetical protein
VNRSWNPLAVQLEARRYAGAARRRLRDGDRKSGDTGRCLVCSGPCSPFESVKYEPKPRLARNVSHCQECGYVAIQELTQDRYRGKTDMEDLPSGGTRIGTEDKPGREYRMARMAVDILGRPKVEVMVYGIGRSLDNHHIAAMRRVSNVAIGDIMKVRDDAEFHDANQPATKKFPVVVASEVVEHFRNPHEDFAKLFQFVARDGLLVCGTNVYAGGDLTLDRYIYWPDHTSYYTPEALLEIAKTNRFYLDFRTPKRAGSSGRKRYVLFTKSPQVLQRIALHFGTRTLAPSE